LLLLLSNSVSAQSREQIYQEGTEALYNLYFSTAEQRFRTLTQMDADDPTYWSAVTSTLWLEIIASQEKLNMDSFSGATIGTSDSKEIVSAGMEAQLRQSASTTISKADARLAHNPGDTMALYAKGNANGILAAFEAIVKGSYIAAFRDAREARNLHAQVLKLDPSFIDAKLTLGLYDYAVGSIPGVIRSLLWIFGLSGGDKAAGIANVAEVAMRGKRAATDAKVLLIVIYNREKQYENALALTSELHRRYPQNYLFEVSEAALNSRLRRFDQSIDTYIGIISKIENHKDGYERLEGSKVLLLLAKAYLDGGQVERGLATYYRVIEYPMATGTDRANAHLWLGKLSDVSGQRAGALPHYDAILTLDCTPELKLEAKKYMKKPFSW
jgi:tetratricopeptide (TPR) repeat protein